MAMVHLLEQSKINVIVPVQVCCGLPMMSKGNTRGVYKNIEYNVEIFSKAIADGYVVITTCSSCSFFLKRHYPLLGGEKGAQVARNTYHFSEYLLKLYQAGRLNTDFRYMPQTVFYQSSCHLRASGMGQPSVDMLRLVPGIVVKHVSNNCCGMGGGHGYEKVNHELSFTIGGKLFSEIDENHTDRVLTDCGGCKLQIEAGTGIMVDHPVILLQEASTNNG